jgi:hypothetical protein
MSLHKLILDEKGNPKKTYKGFLTKCGKVVIQLEKRFLFKTKENERVIKSWRGVNCLECLKNK